MIEPPIMEEMVTLHCTLPNVKPRRKSVCCRQKTWTRVLHRKDFTPPPNPHRAAAESTVKSVTARQSTRCGENDDQASCEAARAPIGCRRTCDSCPEEVVVQFIDESGLLSLMVLVLIGHGILTN